MRANLAIVLLCCLLLAIAGCGNKGPLIPAEDEKQKQNQTAAE